MTQVVIPSGGAYEPDPIEFAKDRVPVFAGENGDDKARYLVYRVFDFGKGDAAGLCHLNLKTINRWRREDAEFRDWEDNELPELRQGLQTKLTLSQFYRNMWLFLNIDTRIITKATLEGLSLHGDPGSQAGLNSDELDYLNRIRGRYSMESLISMLRVAAGDVGGQNGNTNVIINTVIIGSPRGEYNDPS